MDDWTEEDDLLLAEVVLRHLRENSLQLNAFDEVSKRLNKSSGECGYRWNKVVRHQYKNAIKLAKEFGKMNKNIKNTNEKEYLVYNPKEGFLCEDEDRIGGWGYDYKITEVTLKFTNLQEAKNMGGDGENVLEYIG